jgi:branched-chain amino acid transport system permease protein
MTTVLQTIVNGLALGSAYALIALGFTVIYRAAGTMNFAQSSVMLLGGLLVARLHTSIGFWSALGVAAVVTAVVSVLEALLLRAARKRDLASLAIMTIGVNTMLLAEISRQIGADVLTLGDPWGSKIVTIGGITVAETRVASLVVAGVLITAFFVAFRYTRWGLSMRASAMDPEAAALMGIRRGRLELSGWAIAGVLAAVAIAFLAAFPSQGLDQTSGDIALAAFPAAIIGGLGNPAGALLGSLLIGLTEVATATYQNDLTLFGNELSLIAPYVVMVLVLLVRPQGLLATVETNRV